MRILTQNILRCNVKSCSDKDNWLRLVIDKSEIVPAEFNAQTIKELLKKLNYPILLQTASDLNEKSLPPVLEDPFFEDESFLRKIHNILFQFHVIEGQLVCSECKRVYPIKNGIPNLLLDKHEI